jgi:tetratricopeptide (TPR) repeat protein
MASIVPGYEYDVFISYRQKDNKYDGWVTEFAENLKKELEATFKEEISVYFDINPHNGLLETHDVDESLKAKLKCLLFIPIISRTYCDPNSFAWEHEFKAFVEQASADDFGLKVKLANGNIASRVLPIRIHDLVKEDIKLCESIIGGFLRGVEFVYKSPGVNRPLRSEEDNPHDNLNHTIYRDQINKVANAVNEIISGLQSIHSSNYETKDEADAVNDERLKEEKTVQSATQEKESLEQKTSRKDQIKLKYWVISAVTSVVVIIVILSLLIFSSGSTLAFNKRDWVLITDFENRTENTLFNRSLFTAMTLSISQSRYVNILPRSAMLESLARMEKKDRTFIDEYTGREIAIREGIDLCMVPGISEAGNRYAITARIIDAKSGNLLKSEIFYAESEDLILPAIDKISRKIRRVLGESRYNITLQNKALTKVTTSSLEALKLYSAGIDQHLKLDFEGARTYYEAALNIDSGFVAAKASLGNINIERFDPLKGRKLLSQAVNDVDKLTERERLGILAFYASSVEKNIPKAIEYNNAKIKLYPDDAAARNNAGWYYQNSGKYEKAVIEYKESIRIDPKNALPYGGLLWIYLEYLWQPDSAFVWSERMISSNPQNSWGYFYLGSAWIMTDSIKKARDCFYKAREINPYLTMNLYRLAHVYRILENYDEAIRILKSILDINKNEISAFYDLGINYEALGNSTESRMNFSSFKKGAIENWSGTMSESPLYYTSLAAVSARLGDMDQSREMLSKAIEIDSTLHQEFAEVLCIQGKKSEALRQLELALQNGYRDLVWLKLNPDLWDLHYDIRFRDLLTKYFN